MATPESLPSGLPVDIAVVDDDPKVRTRLAMQLGEAAHATPYPDLAAFEDRVTAGTPMLLVLGPSYGNDLRLGEVARLARARPETAAVLVVEQLSTETLRQAMRSGVNDVVEMTGAGGELRSSLEQAARMMVPAAPAAAPAEPRSVGRVVTVFSTKGGSGKSVTAVNLAVLLARRSDKPVAVIDADLQFGDVAVMLNLTPRHTIVDAVGAMERLDTEYLHSLLMRHQQSGLFVLPAPLEPAFADQVRPADMQRIIELLQSFCSYVVVDTPSHFTDVVLSLFELSDDIVLVAGMDIPSIKNVKIGLQTLRLLNVPSSKLRLILNRANSKVKLDTGDVERSLQLQAQARIPSDITVPQSLNRGTPVVLDAPKSGVARSFEQFADLIVAATSARATR